MALGFLLSLFPQLLLIYAHSYWSHLVLLSILGGFLGIALNSIQVLVMESMPEARGGASSVFNFVRFLGFAAAPAVLATIYSAQGINSLYMLNLILLMTAVLFAALIRADNSKNAS